MEADVVYLGFLRLRREFIAHSARFGRTAKGQSEMYKHAWTPSSLVSSITNNLPSSPRLVYVILKSFPVVSSRWPKAWSPP